MDDTNGQTFVSVNLSDESNTASTEVKTVTSEADRLEFLRKMNPFVVDALIRKTSYQGARFRARIVGVCVDCGRKHDKGIKTERKCKVNNTQSQNEVAHMLMHDPVKYLNKRKARAFSNAEMFAIELVLHTKEKQLAVDLTAEREKTRLARRHPMRSPEETPEHYKFGMTAKAMLPDINAVNVGNNEIASSEYPVSLSVSGGVLREHHFI
nr:putative RNA-binding protein [Citrus tristeza virus]WMI31445.1 putative RNA-binding protein [Citrus tristeza virus]WMI31446.1 putative RNA-binding protein [Citrus tristeza virus]WMI31447.1 putative RNA-binding protein [Citrus tristeza virus]